MVDRIKKYFVHEFFKNEYGIGFISEAGEKKIIDNYHIYFRNKSNAEEVVKRMNLDLELWGNRNAREVKR